ncbi:MAG: hypothetical protein A2X49_04540 [Lentisphaerae bacterium GWF2_52_8]|nr:MAG: hypothetical protein A2X49_04540 [Lentisphaerae bacterium GWF2_52_8]
MNETSARNGAYWDTIAGKYQAAVHISLDDFHYGPMIPGDSTLKLLPEELSGLLCLELGCGAAQNSLFLAKQGAQCSALDISSRQLEHASSLCQEQGVKIDLRCGAMEDAGEIFPRGHFDLVHSSYALGFSEMPEKVLADAGDLLVPKGVLLFSVGHPLFAGKWHNSKEGIFLFDYFAPIPDTRCDSSGAELVSYDYLPVSSTLTAVLDAGLLIEAVLEPQAPFLKKLDLRSAEAAKLPYFSKGWLDYYEQLRHVPGVLIVKARKP